MSPDEMADLRTVCPAAEAMTEGTIPYVLLPKLALPHGCSPRAVDALLCLAGLDGYATRLFFAERVSSAKPLNWHVTDRRIFAGNWHAFSWKDVPANQAPIKILSGHLDAFR